ncbi:MAG: gamma-glutamyltranspeptidase [Gaiellaceae bacterium]|nr:MAG: gamma-glutamyltranspeptidase [Gaiellaceae bacterium]
MGRSTLRAMRGAIAAGHPLTAEVGARVLGDGGNAVDACIAAAFAAAVAEGPLTGPLGGGFLLVAEPDGAVVALDCFFAEPERPLGEMEEEVVDFADSGTQVFHVGTGSVAVPGLLQGLEEAHGRYATRPWEELVAPAIELARRGVAVDPPRAFLHSILAGILLRTPEGRRIFGDPTRVETAELVPTLERISAAGSRALAELVPELADDLAVYRVREVAPLEDRIWEARVCTMPRPSRGGEIVLEILAGLAALEPWSLEGEAEVVGRAYRRWSDAPKGTTHIALVDDSGMAVSLSSTLGAGSGVFRGGLQLNNMLGELDVIGTEPRAPGERLPSMMAPTIALDEAGRTRLVLGSAGSVRLAGAIAQVAWRILGGACPAEAIEAPRLHVEGSTVHLEGGWPDAAAEALSPHWQVVRWDALNLYFGGVQAVERTPAGELRAAGDPRRGGVGLVVA